MQQPTCKNIRIRSTADAHKIFGSVQQGILQMVTRRLDADERIALRSGCIYAWEERGPHSEITGLGIERFTEGRRWSPSRVRDEFLFYYEKYSPPPDANHLGGSVERQPPRDWDPLVKQTYSVWVDTEKGRRKWHLTAYFTQATIDQLGTIDDIPRVREVVVPDGVFKSTRVGKSRNRTDDHNRSDVARAATSVTRTYAPFPTPYQYQAQNGSPSMTPVLMHEPYQTSRSQSTYEQSPSPVSPQIPGGYLSNRPSFSNSNTSSSYTPSGYLTSPVSLPQAVGSLPHSNSHYQSSNMHHDTPNYISPAVSPSWNNNNSFYASPASHRPNSHLDTTTSPYHSPSSAPYNSTTNRNHEPVSPHLYSSPIPQLSSPNQLYSPSYSLNAALTPPPSLPPPHSLPQPDVEMRGPPLSPLQIPDRSHAGSYTQVSPTSPVDSAGTDSPDCALAPLNILRRPIRYRREPADEKTLRLLRAPQSNP